MTTTTATVGRQSETQAGSNGSSLCSSSCSLQPLEDMTTCAIHLGRLEEPKLLGCSHAFCLACLEQWEQQQQSDRLTCPLCRSQSQLPPGGARALPPATAHQCVMAYVAGRRCKRALAAAATSVSRVPSLRSKQEMLVHLARDFAGRSVAETAEFDKAELETARRSLNQLIGQLEATGRQLSSEKAKEARDKQEEEEEEEEEDEEEDVEEEEEEEEDEEDACSIAAAEDNDDPLDLALVRRSMKRHCAYKLKEVDVDLRSLDVGDVSLVGDELHELALLDRLSRSLFLYNARQGRLVETPILLRGRRLLCHHIHVSHSQIFVTGRLTSNSVRQSAVVRLSADGHVLSSCLDNGVDFAGICVHPVTGQMVVAQPSHQKVEFFTPDLRSSGHWFTFDSLHPKFVAWTPERNILWVACPNEGNILIVNDRTGVYRKLTTASVCDSVPTHIAATTDGRILFSNGARIFWIVRRREFIFIQRLEHDRQFQSVTGLSALPDGRVLVSDRQRVFALKPARSLKRKRSSRCRFM